jgi:hypothetical protein
VPTIKKIAFSFLSLAILAVAADAAYLYYYSPAPEPNSPGPVVVPQAAPDNSVIAGPVTSITAKSISVKKQDGTTATLNIASTTQVGMAGSGGQPTPKKISDVKTGMMVLVTSSGSDATVAQSIVLLLAPPAQ